VPAPAVLAAPLEARDNYAQDGNFKAFAGQVDGDDLAKSHAGKPSEYFFEIVFECGVVRT